MSETVLGNVADIRAACAELTAYLRATYDVPIRALVVGRCIVRDVASVVDNPVIETYDISARITLERMVRFHVRESLTLWRGARHTPQADDQLVEQLLVMQRYAAKHAAAARTHGEDALAIQGIFTREKYDHA